MANAPTGAVRNNNAVTITTTTAHNLYPGATVLIAGVVDATFDGTFVVQSVPSTTTLTYQQLGAASNSGGSSGSATATLAPQLSAGVHQVSVLFQTRQGYLTQPSPPVTWTASGGRRVQLTGIPLPLGDANVVARVLAFTPAGGASFYYTSGLESSPQMIIADTSTTTVTLDFSDTALLAGTLADPLFRLVELGECAGVIGYSSRLFWWGERNKVDNFENLSFDGGFVSSGAGVRPPLGWTSDNVYGGSGARAFSAIWGGAWEITGDGVANDKGMITQSAASRFRRRAHHPAEHRLFGEAARDDRSERTHHNGHGARASLQRLARHRHGRRRERFGHDHVVCRVHRRAHDGRDFAGAFRSAAARLCGRAELWRRRDRGQHRGVSHHAAL